MEKVPRINRSTKKKSETNKSTLFSIQNLWKKVILNVQYTGQVTVVKLKASISVENVQCFEQKSYIMTFFENNF